MHAVYIKDNYLTSADIALPVHAPEELLIRVAYAGVNHADMLQVEGKYPHPERTPPVVGLEVAGEVASVGEVAYQHGWREGMRVCALLTEGGYAEYATAHAGLCLPLPPEYTMREAAALPEALLTAWCALHHHGKMQAGEHILIHGGASGVGMIACQAARASGAHVFTSASAATKREFCTAQGFMTLDCSTPEQLLHSAKDYIGNIDIVLDILGGAFVAANMKLLRSGGRMISIACMAGSSTHLSAGAMLMKQLSWQGMTLRATPLATKLTMMAQMRETWWEPVLQGRITPHIAATFPLHEAHAAHQLMKSRQHHGKILLEIS